MEIVTSLPALGLVTAVFSGGAAWGAVKVSLNGSRQRIKDIEITLKEHIADESLDISRQAERLTRLETKIDLLLERRMTPR